MTDLPEVHDRDAHRRQTPRDAPRPVGIRAFWKSLGPGIVTGAADDDPSGIATYSIAGAQYGTAFLWTALFTWPLMIAVARFWGGVERYSRSSHTGCMLRALRSGPPPQTARYDF